MTVLPVIDSSQICSGYFKSSTGVLNVRKDDGVSQSARQSANPLSHSQTASQPVGYCVSQAASPLARQLANQCDRMPTNQTASQPVLLLIYSSAADHQSAGSHPASYPAGEPANQSDRQCHLNNVSVKIKAGPHKTLRNTKTCTESQQTDKYLLWSTEHPTAH